MNPWPPKCKTSLKSMMHLCVAALYMSFSLNLAERNAIIDKNMCSVASSLHNATVFLLASTPDRSSFWAAVKTIWPCHGFSSASDFGNGHSQQLPVCCCYIWLNMENTTRAAKLCVLPCMVKRIDFPKAKAWNLLSTYMKNKKDSMELQPSSCLGQQDRNAQL